MAAGPKHQHMWVRPAIDGEWLVATAAGELLHAFRELGAAQVYACRYLGYRGGGRVDVLRTGGSVAATIRVGPPPRSGR